MIVRVIFIVWFAGALLVWGAIVLVEASSWEEAIGFIQFAGVANDIDDVLTVLHARGKLYRCRRRGDQT